MGITMSTASALFEPLNALLAWLLRPIEPAPAIKTVAACPRAVRAGGQNHAQRPAVRPAVRSVALPSRPLRVLRVVDGPKPATGAGRMVISGRMADVCAELDRLAELEAAGR
jgi:hypothetical protein